MSRMGQRGIPYELQQAKGEIAKTLYPMGKMNAIFKNKSLPNIEHPTWEEKSHASAYDFP